MKDKAANLLLMNANKNECGCIFHRSMLLPCRHIFAVRRKLGKPLYDPVLCDNRWTCAYYQSTQRLFTTSSSLSSLAITTSRAKTSRELSQHEKYRKAIGLTSELASVASGVSSFHFWRRIKLLQQLTIHWKNGEEVSLVEIGEGTYNTYLVNIVESVVCKYVRSYSPIRTLSS